MKKKKEKYKKNKSKSNLKDEDIFNKNNDTFQHRHVYIA